MLIHGMGRSPRSLALLGFRLRRAGMTTISFGYHVREAPLSHIAARFAAFVRERARGPYAIVSHSLGGVITRLASAELPGGLTSIAMLAPPNRPPRLAARLGGHAAFRVFTGDAGQRLRDPDFYDALPTPRAPTLVIAGTVGPRFPFEGQPSDGVVALDETYLPGAEHRAVAAIHTLIMNDAAATQAILGHLARHRPGGSGVSSECGPLAPSRLQSGRS